MADRSPATPPTGVPPPKHMSAPTHTHGRAVAAQVQAVHAPVLDRLEEILSRLEEILSSLDAAPTNSHLTVTEFASSVGRSEYRVRMWIKEKRINATKVAGVGPRSRWLIPRSELVRLLGAPPVIE